MQQVPASCLLASQPGAFLGHRALEGWLFFMSTSLMVGHMRLVSQPEKQCMFYHGFHVTF